MRLIPFALMFLAIPLASCSEPARPSIPARTLTSSFHFTFDLPPDWIIISPTEMAARSTDLSPESIGLPTADPETLKALVARAKSGQQEFYLDGRLSSADFTNNISLQLFEGRNDFSQMTPADIDTFCKKIPGGAQKTYGAKVAVTDCKLEEEAGVQFLSYSYKVPSLGIFILQYEYPFIDDKTLVIVGGGRDTQPIYDRLHTAQREISRGVARYLKAQ